MKSEFVPKSRAKRTSPGRKVRGAVTPERLKLAKDPRFLLDRGLNLRGDTGENTFVLLMQLLLFLLRG